jgi:predicted O-methyltransferase YrrM
MGISTAQAVAELVGDTGGGTSPRRGEEIHDFVRRQRPKRCLELGFAHGVGSLYIASALEANDSGRLTTVDIPTALARRPTAHELVDRAGLAHRVEILVEETSYNWYLHRVLREQQRDGAIEPVFDFVFLDGGHTWDADGLAVLLSTRLLRPGGWILLDDLDWKFDERSPQIPVSQRRYRQVQEIWDLLVTTDQAFDELRTDGQWGWARRSLAPVPQVRTVVKRDLVGQARELNRIVRNRLSGRHRPGG